MVPPMTPPVESSSRARYQIEGAVSSRCGSLARSVPREALRPGRAAQAFDAPARAMGLNGERAERDRDPCQMSPKLEHVFASLYKHANQEVSGQNVKRDAEAIDNSASPDAQYVKERGGQRPKDERAIHVAEPQAPMLPPHEHPKPSEEHEDPGHAQVQTPDYDALLHRHENADRKGAKDYRGASPSKRQGEEEEHECERKRVNVGRPVLRPMDDLRVQLSRCPCPLDRGGDALSRLSGGSSH